MKKILVVLLLLLLAFNVFPQQEERFYLVDLNGYDWEGLSEDEKTFYIVGYLSFVACLESFSEDAFDTAVIKERPDEFIAFLEFLNEWSSYSEIAVGDIIRAVNAYYLRNNKDYLILDAILIQSGKNWKNSLKN